MSTDYPNTGSDLPVVSLQPSSIFLSETTRDENAPHTKYLAAYLRQNLIPIRRPHKSEPTILTELSENDQREL